jgi:hypothetical protein
LLRNLGQSPRAALRNARVVGAYLNGAGLALAAWSTSDATATTRAAAADRDLASLAETVKGPSVRADLDAGLSQLLDTVMA